MTRGSLYGGLGYLAFEVGSGLYRRWFGSQTLIEPGEIVSVQINTNDRTDLGGTICLWETLVYAASSCPSGSGQYLPRVELGGMYAYVEYDTPAKTWHPKTYITYDPAVCPLYRADDMLAPFYDDGAGYTATKMYWPTASVVCTHTTPHPVHFFRFDADALEYADPPMPIKPAGWPDSSDTAMTKVPNPPAPSLADIERGLEEHYESPDGTPDRMMHDWQADKTGDQVVGEPGYWTNPNPSTTLVPPDPADGSPAMGVAVVPDCTGLLFAACKARLQDAGFMDVVRDKTAGEAGATGTSTPSMVGPQATNWRHALRCLICNTTSRMSLVGMEFGTFTGHRSGRIPPTSIVAPV